MTRIRTLVLTTVVSAVAVIGTGVVPTTAGAAGHHDAPAATTIVAGPIVHEWPDDDVARGTSV